MTDHGRHPPQSCDPHPQSLNKVPLPIQQMTAAGLYYMFEYETKTYWAVMIYETFECLIMIGVVLTKKVMDQIQNWCMCVLTININGILSAFKSVCALSWLQNICVYRKCLYFQTQSLIMYILLPLQPVCIYACFLFIFSEGFSVATH